MMIRKIVEFLKKKRGSLILLALIVLVLFLTSCGEISTESPAFQRTVYANSLSLSLTQLTNELDYFERRDGYQFYIVDVSKNTTNTTPIKGTKLIVPVEKLKERMLPYNRYHKIFVYSDNKTDTVLAVRKMLSWNYSFVLHYSGARSDLEIFE